MMGTKANVATTARLDRPRHLRPLWRNPWYVCESVSFYLNPPLEVCKVETQCKHFIWRGKKASSPRFELVRPYGNIPYDIQSCG